MINSDEAYETICEIADLTGNSKQSYLKIQDSEICKYLLAAYDPYTKYYLTNCAKGRGEFHFNDLTWELLRQLSTRELSGSHAQQVVNSITKGMTLRSAEVFQRILKKDLRMGMGAKSINKVFPGLIPTHDVMLAKLWDKNRVEFPCFGSPKIDGVRSKFKNGKFYSRNGHEYLGLEHLIEQLNGIEIEIDGELVVPNKTFQESSGLIRNDNPTQTARFYIFELPDSIYEFINRLTIIEDICLVGQDLIKVHHHKLYDLNDVYGFYIKCRDIGYEGAVIKPFNYKYVGSRSYRWMKMKPTLSVDLKVTELFPGKGKYQGQMGGAIVMFNGKPNKVGSGWSDNQRKDLWNKPQTIINKMIEIDYMEETDDGNMRHSRFKGFRPDKD
jgi:DNA ligase-1